MFGDATEDTAALLPFSQGADAKAEMLGKLCLAHVEFLTDLLHIDFLCNMDPVALCIGLPFGKGGKGGFGQRACLM